MAACVESGVPKRSDDRTGLRIAYDSGVAQRRVLRELDQELVRTNNLTSCLSGDSPRVSS